MTNPSISEAEMRAALGLAPSKTPEKIRAQEQAKAAKRYTRVELSVRRKTGGATFRFEYRSSSISTLTAQLEAEKAAREQGLEVWVLLGIEQVSE